MTALTRRQGPILKTLLSCPTVLYAHDLGWLLGRRFLRLSHRGRRSGKVRHTVLEVVRFDPTTAESVVLSAWGERADWYRNIVASPPLEVVTGRDRYVPEYRVLGPEEAFRVLDEYGKRHPLAALGLARLFGYPLRGPEAARLEFARSALLVAFRPRS